MAISEKTFELNITHEILSAADRLWFLLDAVLGHLGRPRSRSHPATAIGLTLKDERRKGWDVRIDPPRGMPSMGCVFIQYKAGTHVRFARGKNSVFRGNWRSTKPHCRFGINNNSAHDQHVTLRALANSFHGHAVYYALPRITSRGALKNWAGRMTLMTTFLRVSEIDALAATGGVLIRKGDRHDIRVSYNDLQRELWSDPLDLGIEDHAPSIVADITTMRIWRALVHWAPIAQNIGEASWQRTADKFTAHLEDFWGNISHLEEWLDEGTTSVERREDAYDLVLAATRKRLRISAQLTERIEPLIAALATGAWVEGDIPRPHLTASIEVAEEGTVISATPVDDIAPDRLDWDAVSYTAF